MNHTSGKAMMAMRIAAKLVPRRRAERSDFWLAFSLVFTRKEPRIEAMTPMAAMAMGMVTAWSPETASMCEKAETPRADAEMMEPT